MPTILHMPVSRVRPDCNWLATHARNVASQDGQDGVIQKVFEIIGPKSRFCIEFGGFDGKCMSNTWRLIVEDGWSGLYAEPDAANFARIADNHPHGRTRAVNQAISWAGETSFDQTMRREGVGPDIDFLSIDIDGNEWHVWNAIADYAPRVVSIEFNPTVPNDVYFIQDADERLNQGSSLLAMIHLGKQKGYSLVCIIGMDAVFVLDKYYGLFNIPSNDIDSMFTPSQTFLFQGYDGTLFTAGMLLLCWKGLPFSHDQLQLLPPGERYFGAKP